MQEHKMKVFRILGVAFLVASGLAFADDTPALWSGAISLLSANPKVHLVSADISLTIHDRFVDVDSTYCVRNNGPACLVDMGHRGIDPSMVGEMVAPPQFTYYQSFVDGCPVSSRLAKIFRGEDNSLVISVAFAARESRLVRENYRTEPEHDGGEGVVSFRLDTGATWNGRIGKATLKVTFAPESELRLPFVLTRWADIDTTHITLPIETPKYKVVTQPGALVYAGPGKPVVDGSSLVFHKANWRPREQDNLIVNFLYPPWSLRRWNHTDSVGGH
jgi:hypothetical protein